MSWEVLCRHDSVHNAAKGLSHDYQASGIPLTRQIAARARVQTKSTFERIGEGCAAQILQYGSFERLIHVKGYVDDIEQADIGE